MSLINQHSRGAALTLIMLAVVAATYANGVARHLDTVVPERHRMYGIPIALSHDVYGLDGYVAYRAVARRFMNDKPVDVILTQDLPKDSNGRMTRDAVEQEEGLFFVPPDDKGDVTFTRIAFRLFGFNVHGLYLNFTSRWPSPCAQSRGKAWCSPGASLECSR